MLAAVAAGFLVAACEQQHPPDDAALPDSIVAELPAAPPADALRVIVRPMPLAFLPRNAEPVSLDRDIAAGVAAELGRPLQLVEIDDYSRMIDALLAEAGDMISASMTVTTSRMQRVAFSMPYLHVDELLVVPAAASADWESLDGRAICARLSSSYAETLTALQESGVPLTIIPQPEDLDTEDIVARVDSGDCPATIVDSHYWSAISGFHDSLAAVRPLVRNRAIAIATRPDDVELERSINEYLVREALTGTREQRYSDDLDGLSSRRRLRMITRNGAASYFLYRGSPYGFEFELMERFAARHRLRLEIVIPPTGAELIPWLLEGRGDVIAAMLAITPERARDVAFSRPYLYEDQVLVTRSGDPLQKAADLAGRTIAVRASSSYFATALNLQREHPLLRLELLDEASRTEEILAAVESGEHDMSIADGSLLGIEQRYGRSLEGPLIVREADPLGWAVRPENTALLEALNEFIAEEYRGLFYNMRRSRYFENSKTIGTAQSELRADVSGRISPFDDLIRRYSHAHDLDWRLIAAQMFQESRFDPSRKSWAGAEGLMQLLPRTAAAMGFESDLHVPEVSIDAGTRYLRRMIDLFDPKLPLQTRIRFALASYNAGRAHVLDAQRLARQLGLSPALWYGNVERAILLLQKPEYHEKSRFGYVRGGETAHYVRSIESRYRTYVDHVPDFVPELDPGTAWEPSRLPPLARVDVEARAAQR